MTTEYSVMINAQGRIVYHSDEEGQGHFTQLDHAVNFALALVQSLVSEASYNEREHEIEQALFDEGRAPFPSNHNDYEEVVIGTHEATNEF